MWLLFCLFFHVSTGWARMPKPCFIAQIYCFLRCCTKSFGYKYLLNYINIYKLLTHKYIPDTHVHVICIVMVSQGGLSGIFLRKDRDSCFASAARFLAPQALRGFLLRKRCAITNPSGFSSRLSSHEGPKACASGPSLRKDRDSNPGCPQGHNGFRDRPDRPLRHLSVYHTRSHVSFCGCKGTK